MVWLPTYTVESDVFNGVRTIQLPIFQIPEVNDINDINDLLKNNDSDSVYYNSHIGNIVAHFLVSYAIFNSLPKLIGPFYKG